MPRKIDAAALAKVRAKQAEEAAKVEAAKAALRRMNDEARALEARLRLAREAEVGALAGKAGLLPEADTTLEQGFVLVRRLILGGRLLAALAALDAQDGWEIREGDAGMALQHTEKEQHDDAQNLRP